MLWHLLFQLHEQQESMLKEACLTAYLDATLKHLSGNSTGNCITCVNSSSCWQT